jgi:polysaccharide biosynthesis transport protein
MREFPYRPVAALPGQRTVDVEAVEIPADRPARSITEILLARSRLIVGFTALVVAIVGVWTFTTRPVYEAATVLQIDPDRPRVLSFGDVMPREESSNDRAIEAYYQTQVELIASRNTLARAIESLKLRDHPALAPGQGRMERLRTMVARLVAWPGAGRPQVWAADEFVEQMSERVRIEPIKRSRLVRISARVPDRDLAALIPNQIAHEYIAMTNAQRRDASEAASKWLEGQLGGLKARSEQASGAIQQFVEKYNLVPTRDGKTEFALQQLEDGNRVFTDAESDRIQKEARYKMLESADPDTLAAALGSELVRGLKADYSRLEREVGRARTVYGPQHPKMIELEAELSLAKMRLDTEVKKGRQAVEQEYQAAVRRAGELGRRLDTQRQLAINSHARGMQLQLLKRDAETTESVYADLMKRLKEVQVAADLRVTNVTIADAARKPLRPASPKKARNLALAALGGLIGGAVLAFFREAGDQTLRTPREVNMLVRLPSLGTVPAVRAYNRRALPAVDDLPARAITDDAGSWPAQIAGEAFRSIRALVLHSHALDTPRVILMTSAQPQEGKSFTAVNLAVALAEGGEKVLLVDADFRRASCHRAFGLEPPEVGLSSILYRGLQPEVALLTTGVTNLTFLPAGPKPPDPAALLSSEKAKSLLTTLRSRYPWVIIDSPPVLAVSDASVLAPQVDGVLLVVRAHATPVEAVQIARDRLEALGARILGVVLNDVKLARNRYFYANYGYYARGDAQESA